MSKTIFKTTYSEIDGYGCTKEVELYCIHSHSQDATVFYDNDGEITLASFHHYESGNDLWDAMQRLYHPFKNEWG